jgi:GDP-L-fucose synthase
MLNIVVTGGNGFLLGNYIKDYNHNFIAPRSVDVNWVTGKGIDTLPDEPDVFIHSAAIYGGLPFNQNNPKRVLLDNTKMSVNVFEYIFRAKPKKVIMIGSCCAYPNRDEKFTEDMLGEGRPQSTVELYAMSKLWHLAACERLVDDWTCLVLANMYGLGEIYKHEESSHVIGSITKKIMKAKEDNTDVQLLGTGTPTRPLVYVKDVCDVIDFFATSRYTPNGAYNVGEEEGITIKEMAETIADVLQFKGKILWGDPKDNGSLHRAMSYDKLNKIHPYRIRTKLREGLNESISFISSPR